MWEEIRQFMLENWKEIAAVGIFILSSVIALVRARKKGMSFQEAISGILMEQLPLFISESETNGGTGEKKRVFVLNKALTYVSQKLGRPLTQVESDIVISFVGKQIEAILTTPQKKGVAKKVR